MRSSLLLSALCATGILAVPLEQRDYVTDLTVITVTETVTGQPAPAPTTAPAEQAPAPQPTPESTSPVDPPTPATSDLPPPMPTITPKSENPPPEQQQQARDEGGFTIAWTEAWTTAWTLEAESPPQTTLATQTQEPGAAPTNPYQETLIYNHNVHRSNHSADSLSWSADLEASAHKLASQCVYKHDTSIDGGGYGQNIGYGIDSPDIGKMITNLMYNNEFAFFEPYYGQASPDMTHFDKWGHFTQIVWKGTKQVGCATVVCDKLGNVDASSATPFTVCNYSPSGNFDGEYANNVLRPQGHQFLQV